MAWAVRIHEHGGADVLRLEEVDDTPPGTGEVSISVRAIGLNRSEVMFRNGRHVESAIFPARLGYEAAGVVTAVGEGVMGFSDGDRVCLVPPPSVTRWGTSADTVTVPAEYVVPVGPSMGMVDAAATWMAAITAYGMMLDVGGLTADDTLLVLAAASSVGLAAMQLARFIGAQVIATTRSEEKAQDLRLAGADEVIVTNAGDLAEQVLRHTGGAGVRLALDPIAGPGLADVIASCAMGGSIVLYGELDLRPAPLPVLDMIGKGLALRGFTFKEVVRSAERRSRAVGFIQHAISTGALHPRIDRVFSLHDIAEAHDYLEHSSRPGKVVVVL